jgi:hypothetical protein
VTDVREEQSQSVINWRRNIATDAVVAAALKSTDRAVVEDAMALVDEVCDSMKSQLDLAECRRYDDPNWWRRINHALRCRVRDRQRLQRRLGDLRRAGHTSREELFIRCAKQLLDPQTFQAIWDKVHAAKANGGTEDAIMLDSVPLEKRAAVLSIVTATDEAERKRREAGEFLCYWDGDVDETYERNRDALMRLKSLVVKYSCAISPTITAPSAPRRSCSRSIDSGTATDAWRATSRTWA